MRNHHTDPAAADDAWDRWLPPAAIGLAITAVIALTLLVAVATFL